MTASHRGAWQRQYCLPEEVRVSWQEARRERRGTRIQLLKQTPPLQITKLLGETSQPLWRSHTQVSKGLPLVSASLKVPPCQQHSEKHAPHTWALERLIISQAQQGNRENEIFHGRLVKIGAQSYGFRMPDCRMLKVCGIYCVVDKETIYLHGDIFMYRDS